MTTRPQRRSLLWTKFSLSIPGSPANSGVLRENLVQYYFVQSIDRLRDLVIRGPGFDSRTKLYWTKFSPRSPGSPANYDPTNYSSSHLTPGRWKTRNRVVGRIRIGRRIRRTQRKYSQVMFCPSWIPQEVTWDWTITPVVKSYPPASWAESWCTLFPNNQWDSELLYDWRFTADQFVLVPKPLETHEQKFFFATEPLMSQSLRHIPSDERIFFSFMNRLGLCQVKYPSYGMIMKFFPFKIYRSFSLGFARKTMPQHKCSPLA
jgi:hypothetical protein